MPNKHPKTRQQRREEQQQNYLTGRAIRPYCHTPTLNESFGDDDGAGPSTATVHEVYPKCNPVLSRYEDIFRSFVHQGSELKNANLPIPIHNKLICNITETSMPITSGLGAIFSI